MIQRNQLGENHLTPTGNEPPARAIVQGKRLVLSEKKPEWKMCFDSADPEELKCCGLMGMDQECCEIQMYMRNVLKTTESLQKSELCGTILYLKHFCKFCV